MARSYQATDNVRDSRMNHGPQSNTNACGDCGKPVKGTGTLCKNCREEFSDIIGGVK